MLRLDVGDLPLHRDWPQLLSALRTTLRWLDRPELARSSEYLRASQARDLLEEIRPRLSHAGVITSWRGGEMARADLLETVESALLALGQREVDRGQSASFEVYAMPPGSTGGG